MILAQLNYSTHDRQEGASPLGRSGDEISFLQLNFAVGMVFTWPESPWLAQ
jgi:hypothetical protein